MVGRAKASRLGLVARVRAAGMRHEPLRGYALLSPTMAWMLVALAIPLVILVTLSFWTQASNSLDFDRSFSLKNYIVFFEKPIYLKLLLKSVKISGAVSYTHLTLPTKA